MATNPTKSVLGQKSRATVTISTATTGLSDIIDIGNYGVRSIEMSAAWTAASITFMGAASSTAAMKSVRTTTASLELTYISSQGYVMAVDPTHFSGMRYLQLRSGSTATPVAQVAARTVYLGLTKVDH